MGTESFFAKPRDCAKRGTQQGRGFASQRACGRSRAAPGTGAVPTRVHVAHRGLFVVAVDVQHLLVRRLGLELLHLLGGLLERGLQGERPRGGAAVSTRTLLLLLLLRRPPPPPNRGDGVRYPPVPRSPLPGTARTSDMATSPARSPLPASAAPPPPLGRFTPHQSVRWPIPAPRATRRQSGPAGGGEKPGKGPMRRRRGMGGLRGGEARRSVA